jgi:methanogenic corrinoid protein MtbC1
MSDEINIQELGTPELLQQMGYDLYDGLAPEVEAEVKECLKRGMTAYEVMTQGLVAGMDVVGADFRDGILFVPEVLMAAKAMKAGMEILRPLLAETGAAKVGKMVIGTVKGDIHDIGKNLVAMMLEGAGIEVINLGVNCNAEKYLTAIREHQPDFLGMSALLTTTMPYMKVVIQALIDDGLRDKVTVLVGGAPLNEAFAAEVGADYYCRDAAVAVETARKVIAIKKAKQTA